MSHLTLFWSQTALESLGKLLDYLADNSSSQYAEKYRLQIQTKITELVDHPEIFMRISATRRRCQIDKFNYIIFTILNDRIVINDILPYARLKKGFNS